MAHVIATVDTHTSGATYVGRAHYADSGEPVRRAADEGCDQGWHAAYAEAIERAWRAAGKHGTVEYESPAGSRRGVPQSELSDAARDRLGY